MSELIRKIRLYRAHVIETSRCLSGVYTLYINGEDTHLLFATRHAAERYGMDKIDNRINAHENNIEL